ncbi:MAG TPA: glycosyl hydrolase [Mycobacteriales bacterium]|nr:glycosyl hydrolase [Mycobacteriales bacterium]
MSLTMRRRASAVAAALSLLFVAGAGEAAAATHHGRAKHHRHHHLAIKRNENIRHAKPSTKSKVASAALGSHVAFGAFAQGFSGSGLQITQLEKQLGGHLAIASSFQGFGDVFPDTTERAQAASGHVLLVSWGMGEDAASRFTTFTDGSHDAYLAQVAAAVAAFGKPIYIRPWAEMNADWSTFQPTADGSQPAGGTPEEFIAAWRYVVTFFRDHGATNARWVFNPTTDTYAQTTDVATIFPGTAYVDVLGLDGYNWGNGGLLHWQSFSSIYGTQYQRLVALDPAAPVWVCEFASKEPAESDGAPQDPDHSKADWYRELLASTDFPAIKALVFFDVDKERDWRVGSDAQSLAVVSAAVRAA